MRIRIGTLALALTAGWMVPATAAVESPATRILLTSTADPATSQYVSWSRSRVSAGQRVVTKAPDGTVRTAPAVRKLGTSKRTAGSRQYRYVAKLTGLEPSTQYRYRIVTAGGATPWRTFSTAGTADHPFTFLQFGDTQVDNAGVPNTIIDAATRRHRDAGLLLHAGDVVNHPWVGREWAQLHQALSPVGQSANWLAAIGNHEQCRLLSSCRSGTGRGFKSYFHAPSNGFSGQRRTWFFVDQGPARFIVLDSFGSDLKRQRAFLKQALQSNGRAWSIVLMHAGPFASVGHRHNTEMRKWFLPTLQKYGADLVLSGHDHSYARGHKNGVTYLTSVSGPKYYASSGKDWRAGGATRVKSAYRTSTYQAVTVTPDRLTVRSVVGHRAKGATPAARIGQTLDSFVLTHRAGR